MKDGDDGQMTLKPEQYLNVAKSTLGIQMVIRVEQHFKFQRFSPAQKRFSGGQQTPMERMR